MYLSIWVTLLVTLSTNSFSYAQDGPGPTVQIQNGQLLGTYLNSRGGRTFAAFKGIPYAQPQTRFEVAEPATDWAGVRDASVFGSVCAQFDPAVQKVVGSEDCLFINVYSPKLRPRGRLPVLVFIHGGGLRFGNSDDIGPDYMMDEDVVFVTINYRLGPFGFLSTGDSVIPGNLGLKDQTLALEWIQKNIAQFGGNPGSVTISGESAGGTCVGLHIVSPMSRGLFRRTITSSLTAFNNHVVTDSPLVPTLAFAQRFNCDTSSSAEIKACLEGKSIEELFTPVPAPLYVESAFYASIEPSDAQSPFLTATPQQLYAQGQFAKVPMLSTFNEFEGLFLYSAVFINNDALKNGLLANWTTLAPLYFGYADVGYSAEVQNKISDRILKFYFSPSENPVSDASFWNLTNLFTDASEAFGVRESILTHASHNLKTFAAILSIDGIFSQIISYGITKPLGMSHTDDLQYLFSASFYPKFAAGSDLLAASQRLVRTYTNFATFGDPNYDQNNRNWKAVGAKELRTRVVDWMYVKNTEQYTNPGLVKNRLAFWDKLHELAADAY